MSIILHGHGIEPHSTISYSTPTRELLFRQYRGTELSTDEAMLYSKLRDDVGQQSLGSGKSRAKSDGAKSGCERMLIIKARSIKRRFVPFQ
ncbi:unnamed protein product [Fusarium venenatum]|uniref:Uncharacterized protein n=1 Tax=Fusarium venenatum TaxID=56646 RepID=A0A2L2SYR9_9HYPO|nr:uncharacterized protein FVRRES_06445 [Fusarium venenatum]CEI62009.1 unnamed protein product [Fusarium venenatum]